MSPTRRHLLNRGITLPIPPALKDCASLLHRWSGTSTPAMLAAVRRPDGRGVALQVRHLTPDGSTARLRPFRYTIGELGSGAVWLAPAGTLLGLAEGVETGLSAMQLFGVPCWATLGAGRLAGITLPDFVRRVVIFADNDKPGLDGADAAVERYRTLGRDVEVRLPPDDGTDWNDVLQAQRRAA